MSKLSHSLFTVLAVFLALPSGLMAGECTLEIDGEIVALEYQYAVHLSDPENAEEPVLSRLICTAAPFAKEQLWDWSRFREDFHAEGHQGFYLQFQDGQVIVVGLAGHEENFTSATFPDLKFEGEIGAGRVAGVLKTDPAPTAFDDDLDWTVTATVDLVPVPSW